MFTNLGEFHGFLNFNIIFKNLFKTTNYSKTTISMHIETLHQTLTSYLYYILESIFLENYSKSRTKISRKAINTSIKH